MGMADKRLSFITLAEVVLELEKGKNGGVIRYDVPVELLRDRLQLRHESTLRPVEAYAEQMRNGQEFPPVLGFIDPSTKELVIADGNSRLEASVLAGLTTFTVEFHLGDRRAATLAAARANLRHGLCASLADRRAAGFTVLRDKELAGWSNRHLGRLVGLSAPTIEILREELEAENQANGLGSTEPNERKYVREGKVHTVKVKAKAARKSDPEKAIDRIAAKVAASAARLDADARGRLAEKLRQMFCRQEG